MLRFPGQFYIQAAQLAKEIAIAVETLPRHQSANNSRRWKARRELGGSATRVGGRRCDCVPRH
jgi:hypothetical protein